MHNHPVEGGLVFKPGDYVYGSAKGYSGKKRVLGGAIVVKQYMPRDATVG